jgi:hypothetical protein
VLCWVMTLTSPFLLPTPFIFAASDLGPLPLPVPSRAITVNGPGHEGTIISGPHLALLPGRYLITVKYEMTDASSHAARFQVRVVEVSKRTSQTTRVMLTPSTTLRKTVVELNVTTPEQMSTLLTWRGSGHLTVASVKIAKVATCRVVECQGGWL